MPSSDLPPLPPPLHVRARLDDAVVRADRARFLSYLSRCNLGIGRLLLLWAVAAVFVLGWSFVGMAWMAFEERHFFSYVYGLILALLGAGVLIPAAFWFARGAKRDRQVRRLLYAWAESDRDPVADARLREPVLSLIWLLTSFALGAIGLWATFAAAASTRPGGPTYGEVAYTMGIGQILWLTGLLGLAKAVTHYRWAVRAFRG
ncbi:hypothetical protein OG625_15225 [Streptomyces sp. NBC_01351]|uniref:hypothetical protein n=1 Tax=Streptomyces sp. NBC_01351 TaxID=2903833 RepID=UPI002E34F331|nr:hypothetical protein [Streptomyces sp. NBC_01351]